MRPHDSLRIVAQAGFDLATLSNDPGLLILLPPFYAVLS